MRFSWEHLVAIGAAVVVVLLAWFSPSWFHVTGLDRAILSGGILVIGAACIGGFLLWARSKQRPMPSMAMQAPSAAGVAAAAAPTFSGIAPAPEDLNLLIREAETKVKSARLGQGAKLAGLRVVVVLGEAGSGKTTSVLHSGLDPELLAGQVFQEGNVAPTAVANFWFARKSVLIEAGPGLLSEPRLWTRLIQRLTPRGLRAMFGGKSQGERAALVCFDCEKLANAKSADSIVASARALRDRLEEMSKVLGSSFPVYVLFTRADRLSYFDDFVSTMTNDESSQVLGVTLPVASESATSVYAERETKRLTAAFNSLFYSLADHRPGLLSRERNTERQAGVYEFPRQFRKLAKPAVQFLVDLCRPSQLRAGPFLRGFYFIGMRTVASSSSPSTLMATRTSFGAPMAAPASNATSILRQEDLLAAAAAGGWQTSTQMPSGEGRKVSQWVFLSHIFSQILLQDRGALGASSVSTRMNYWRRALLATAAIVCFIWILGSIVSYLSNRALESDFIQAEQNVHASNSPAAEPPSIESLQKLEVLRKSLAELTGYERNGAPLHLRWGLYAGHDFYPEARRVYFLEFRRLLFGQIQTSIVDVLRRLPNTPEPNDDYISNYDTLKAYLITTSDSDKSTPDFLSPVLQRYLTAGQNLDSNVLGLARTQFEFYASELKVRNPYSSDTDAAARDHARDFLNHFGAVPRIYTAMQNAAAKQNAPVNFYREHPDATDLIRSVSEVPGAFTKGGWDFMQNAMIHSDQYFRGEEWVLGNASEAITNRADLEKQLRTMYQADFTKDWQDFLRNARVASYAGTEDAVRKLKKLSATESPLLALLCDASQNTTGRSRDLDAAFKPVQQVAISPACASSVSPILIPYVAALAKYENCLETMVSAPPEQKAAQKQMCISTMNEGKLVVTAQIMPAAGLDPVGHINQTVEQLLEAPLVFPEPTGPVGTGAKGLCDSFAGINAKFPFKSNYDVPDVSIQEFDAFFRPDTGTLQKFILGNQGVLVPQGSQFAVKPGAKVEWGPAFLPFVNQAHFIQQSLYPAAGAGPVQLKYQFNVRAILPEGGISGVTFTLNGQTLTYPGGPQTASFIWPGTGPQAARISYRAGGSQDTDLLSAQGPWAIIRLLSLPGAKVTSSGSTLSAEWHALQADGRTPLNLSGTGKPIVVHLDFDGGGAPFVLQGGNFSNLVCRASR
ncbi:MAG: ImcF-related family protein [Candidatus Acidiferrales bacterium]|jgi:type VI secretion system protein ImpL